MGLREQGLLEITISKAKQSIAETQQDAETGLMVECFL
jgi:hypothetical protein